MTTSDARTSHTNAVMGDLDPAAIMAAHAPLSVDEDGGPAYCTSLDHADAAPWPCETHRLAAALAAAREELAILRRTGGYPAPSSASASDAAQVNKQCPYCSWWLPAHRPNCPDPTYRAALAGECAVKPLSSDRQVASEVGGEGVAQEAVNQAHPTIGGSPYCLHDPCPWHPFEETRLRLPKFGPVTLVEGEPSLVVVRVAAALAGEGAADQPQGCPETVWDLLNLAHTAAVLGEQRKAVLALVQVWRQALATGEQSGVSRNVTETMRILANQTAQALGAE